MKERKHYTDRAIRSLTALAIGATQLASPTQVEQPDPIFPCPKPAHQVFLPTIQRSATLAQKATSSGTEFKVEGVTEIAKIFGGNWDDPPETKIINGFQSPHYHQIYGADLGPPTRYKDKYFFALGDVIYDLAAPQDSETDYKKFVDDVKIKSNFLVPWINCSDTTALPPISGYLNMRTHPRYPEGVPVRGLDNREAEPLPESSVLPSALTTIKWKGQEHLIAHYMNTPKWSNFNIAYSAIAKYDDNLNLFTPYKSETNIWPANDRGVAQFALVSFWQDEAAGFLYMVGASNDRFGGAKLARISLDSFLDQSNQTDWQYYLGQESWSNPTKSLDVINNQAAWIIPPKDSGWTLDKGLSKSGVDWCTLMTVSEFGIIYNPYLERFLLMYGDANCPPYGIRIHSSSSITGPWDNAPQIITMPDQNTDNYGTFTTDALLKGEKKGQKLRFVFSKYKHYGVYIGELEFKK